MHRLGEIGGCDVNVLPAPSLVDRSLARLRLFGHDKPEPAGIGLEPPDHQVHLLGDAVTVAANPQDRPVADQRLELPIEVVALLPGNPQELRELARGGGMVNVVFDEVENVVA